MRDTLDIRLFDKGIVSNYDPSDITPEAATDSWNIDINVDGKLQTLPMALIDMSTIGGVTVWATIVQDDGTYDAIWSNGTNLYTSIGVFNLSAPTTTDKGTYAVRSLQPLNRGVYIGTTTVPYWIGKIAYGQFSGSAPTGYVLETLNYTATYMLVNTLPDALHTPAVAEEYFQAGTYWWKTSLIFDGLEEGQLSSDAGAMVYAVGSAYSVEKFDMTITASGFAANLSKRVTGVNVYRAYSSIVDINGQPQEQYRLVKTIDINDAGWATSNVIDKVYTFEDVGKEGATYEQNTGLPETLDQSTIGFELSCQHNSELVIGKCYTSLFDDAKYCLVKSLQARFGLYNWLNLIKLPEIPTAMASYGGKIYVFTANRMFRIDGEGFYVEDDIVGVGCTSQTSILSTDYGLFWKDSQNFYRMKGFDIEPIGITVQDLLKARITNPVIGYDARYMCVFIGDKTSDKAMYFHVIKEKWGYTPVLCGGASFPITALIPNYTGRLLGCISTGLYDLFAVSGYNRDIYYETPDFYMNDVSQEKVFYYFKIDTVGTNNLIYYYSLDSGTNWARLYLNETNPAINNQGDMIYASGWKRGVKIRFKITSNTVVNPPVVKSMSCIYRGKIGKR